MDEKDERLNIQINDLYNLLVKQADSVEKAINLIIAQYPDIGDTYYPPKKDEKKLTLMQKCKLNPAFSDLSKRVQVEFPSQISDRNIVTAYISLDQMEMNNLSSFEEECQFFEKVLENSLDTLSERLGSYTDKELLLKEMPKVLQYGFLGDKKFIILIKALFPKYWEKKEGWEEGKKDG